MFQRFLALFSHQSTLTLALVLTILSNFIGVASVNSAPRSHILPQQSSDEILLSQGKPSTASTYVCSETEPEEWCFPPSNANDGDPNTFWLEYGWGGTRAGRNSSQPRNLDDDYPDHQWWMVDLEQAYDLTRVDSLWDNCCYWPDSYTIDASIDGVDFITVLTRTADLSYETTDVVVTQARYVRINVYGYGGYAQAREFKVYGRTLQQAPSVVTSYYMSAVDTSAAFQLGCTARRNGEQGLVVLNFGSPRNLGTDSEPIHGTRLRFGLREYASLNQITSAVEAFAIGYYEIAVCNNPPSDPVLPRLTIAVGTTNSKVYIDDDPDEPFGDNPALTREHGVAWGDMIDTINSYLETVNYYPAIQASGAYDAERGPSEWSSYTPTLAWAEGFNGSTTAFYYNFGSCESCPRSQLRSSWTAANLQAVEEVFTLSWGLSRALPLPQIYFAPYAMEWYNVRRYASEQARNMTIRGVVTSCEFSPPTPGCSFNDPRDWRDVPVDGESFLSPRQGWQALYDTLNALRAPDGSPNTKPQPNLQYVTDITVQ